VPLEREVAMMTTTEFYGWQLLWYVFATLTAFAAALVFWKKGPAALVRGKGGMLGVAAWKLSGASAIFVIVLGTLHFMNPLKALSDYSRVLVIYQPGDTQSRNGNGASHGVVKISADQISDERIKLDPGKVAVEMIPYDSIESLLPEGDGKSFSTARAVAPGTYKFRVMEYGTGKFVEIRMDVPRQ
jgi:hypothetical protein